MKVCEICILFAILGSLVVPSSSSPRNWNDDDDDEYRLLKRFLFHKDTTKTPSGPGVIDQIIFRTTSTRSPFERPVIWGQTTRQPSYPSGACQANSCEHGGICISKGQMTYECKCVGPWRGIYCGIADACYNLPCQNGGTCLNVHDDYWCKCPSEYYGTNCQSKFYNPGDSISQPLNSNCRPNICNTGRCVSLKTTYYCQCPDDRYGEHCEKRFFKRQSSKRQMYRELLEQMNRDVRSDSDDRDKIDATYYDPRNGIFF